MPTPSVRTFPTHVCAGAATAFGANRRGTRIVSMAARSGCLRAAIALQKIFVVMAVLSVLAVLPVAAVYEPDVGSNDFDTVVDGGRHALVEFYAPWCGHCKALAPEFRKVGEAYADRDDVVIAQVDADKHRELGQRFQVRGYPTLLWFAKGRGELAPEPVQAGRTAKDLMAFVAEKSGILSSAEVPPGMLHQVSPTELERKIAALRDAEGRTVVVVAHEPATSSLKTADLAAVARAFRDEPLAMVVLDTSQAGAAEALKRHAHLRQTATDGGALVAALPTNRPAVAVPLRERVRSRAELFDALNVGLGYDLLLSGDLQENAGVDEELESMLIRLMRGERGLTIQSVKQAADRRVKLFRVPGGPRPDSLAYYAKLAGKLGDHGSASITVELSRLEGLLKQLPATSLSKRQVRSFYRRLNVLRRLAPVARQEAVAYPKSDEKSEL